MPQITAKISDATVASLDHAAQILHRSRADIVRQAIAMYLDDFVDISISIDRLWIRWDVAVIVNKVF